MTASTLVILVSTSAVKVLIVWDWRTGDIVRVIDFRLVSTLIPPLQILEWSSVEHDFLHNQYSKFTFLDEFRLLTSTGQPVVGEGGLDLTSGHWSSLFFRLPSHGPALALVGSEAMAVPPANVLMHCCDHLV
jgi:hypothetical protein